MRRGGIAFGGVRQMQRADSTTCRPSFPLMAGAGIQLGETGGDYSRTEIRGLHGAVGESAEEGCAGEVGLAAPIWDVEG